MMGLLLIFCTVPVFAENQSNKIPDTVNAEEVSAETVPEKLRGRREQQRRDRRNLNTEGGLGERFRQRKTADTGAVSDAEVTPEKGSGNGRNNRAGCSGSGECRRGKSGGSSSKPRCGFGGSAGTSEVY